MGMILIAGEYEVPDSCPENCGFVGDIERYGQGSVCMQCPVFCCTGGDPLPLVDPMGYRKDWAKSWCEFFKGDMKELPLLPLFKETEDEEI